MFSPLLRQGIRISTWSSCTQMFVCDLQYSRRCVVPINIEIWRPKDWGTRWFKLNDGNVFLGQSSRPFFESDRKHLHRALTKTWSDIFLLRGLSSANIFREIWASLDPIHSAKRSQTEKPRRSGLGIDIQNACAKFRVLSLKSGVGILTFVRKHMLFTSSRNYLVSVWAQMWALNMTSYWRCAVRSSNICVKKLLACLWVPAIGSFRGKKAVFHAETPDHSWPFWIPVVGGDTLRH